MCNFNLPRRLHNCYATRFWYAAGYTQLGTQNLPTQVGKTPFRQSAQADFALVAAISIARLKSCTSRLERSSSCHLDRVRRCPLNPMRRGRGNMFLKYRQVKPEGRPYTHFTLETNAAVVALNDVPDDRQSQPGPF
jgi:hypothetical protein